MNSPACPPTHPHAAPTLIEAPCALELRALHKCFGQTDIIRGVSLAVARTERVALIGPNGAGKSTLCDLVGGRLAPTSGEVWLNGQRISGKKPFEINRLGLSRSFQLTQLFAHISALDNVRCAALWSMGHRYSFWRLFGGLSAVTDRAATLLRQVGLQHRCQVLAAHLTYAEQRALELAVTLASGASVVLLDEPTAGMSQSETQHFTELIRELTVDKTLLVVEHDMGVVFGLADRVAVLVLGELIAVDTPEAVRANRRVQEAYLGAALAAEPKLGR